MDDFKWFAIMLMVLFFVLGIGISIAEYSDGLVDRAAIKNGLVQDDNGHWVKSNE